MKTLDEAADCIEASAVLNDWKVAFAKHLREGQIDLLSLNKIASEARRVSQACRLIETLMRAESRRPRIGTDEQLWCDPMPETEMRS